MTIRNTKEERQASSLENLRMDRNSSEKSVGREDKTTHSIFSLNDRLFFAIDEEAKGDLHKDEKVFQLEKRRHEG